MDKKYTFDKSLFAERIKQARKSRNLTQEALSTLLNINVNTLAKCESPRNKLTLGYTNLIELVNVLDVDVNYLFRKEQYSNEENRTVDNLCNLIEDLTDKEKSIALDIIKSLIDNRQQ